MTDVLRTIIIVIVHTPLWVWGLYALLLFLGLQRTRDSVVTLWRMLILPAVVTLLAISSVIGAGLDAVSATLLGLAAGAVAGWPLERPGWVRRMPGSRLWLRGEWLSLGQIVLVLVARYATNAVGAMNPVLHANPIWHLGTLFVCSLLSGIFLGRTARRLRRYFSPLQHGRNPKRPRLPPGRIPMSRRATIENGLVGIRSGFPALHSSGLTANASWRSRGSGGAWSGRAKPVAWCPPGQRRPPAGTATAFIEVTGDLARVLAPSGTSSGGVVVAEEATICARIVL